MKKLRILLIISFWPISLQSQNYNAPDTIHENTIWDYDTVFLDNNLFIPNYIVLEIKPSTTVIANDYYKIDVQGSIKAIGNENEMIKFTVADTTGFSDSSNISGGWDGFIFNNIAETNDSSIFEY